jgi:hypothetical protein
MMHQCCRSRCTQYTPATCLQYCTCNLGRLSSYGHVDICAAPNSWTTQHDQLHLSNRKTAFTHTLQLAFQTYCALVRFQLSDHWDTVRGPESCRCRRHTSSVVEYGVRHSACSSRAQRPAQLHGQGCLCRCWSYAANPDRSQLPSAVQLWHLSPLPQQAAQSLCRRNMGETRRQPWRSCPEDNPRQYGIWCIAIS